jgi:hypothetical protein
MVIENYTIRSLVLNGNSTLPTLTNIDILPFYNKSDGIDKRKSKVRSQGKWWSVLFR